MEHRFEKRVSDKKDRYCPARIPSLELICLTAIKILSLDATPFTMSMIRHTLKVINRSLGDVEIPVDYLKVDSTFLSVVYVKHSSNMSGKYHMSRGVSRSSMDIVPKTDHKKDVLKKMMKDDPYDIKIVYSSGQKRKKIRIEDCHIIKSD